jgi:predicted ATPase
MILINICGGPGAGKTTLAYYLTFRLKKAGIHAEFVGEAAREHHIYDHDPKKVPAPLLDNQVLLAGQQYERILRLKRHEFEVVVSDSPLAQGLLYCEDHAYFKNLKATIRDLEKSFETYNVWVNPRPGSYNPESRVQKTEAEARALDKTARKLVGTIWYEADWDEEEKLGDEIIALALSKRKKKRPRSKSTCR